LTQSGCIVHQEGELDNHGKASTFVVKEHDPFNGEPPLEDLRAAPITPTPLFFARSHGTIPAIDGREYRLAITGLVREPCSLSLDDLKNRYPATTLTATLQCAGNRRQELAAYAPVPGELPWGAGAIGTAEWTGARLTDVLTEGLAPGRDAAAYAAAPQKAQHVHLTGLDEVRRQERAFGFGGSIPLEKALAPEVLLAYAMNGEPLAPVHGFPLRLVVPGYIGARSVKWLGEIHLSDQPSDNYFYTHAYQLFPSWENAGTVDWSSGIKLGEIPVTSVICLPGNGERVACTPVRIEGYAYTGGGRRVERVEVTADGGRRWQAAQLDDGEGAWTWRFWQVELDLPAGEVALAVRAWDSGANTQPERVDQVWNFKGYMNNAWHRVKVTGTYVLNR
jgi:sulfite oxidase